MNKPKPYVLAVTGPRNYEGGHEPIVAALSELLVEQPNLHLLIGGARGFDVWTAYAASRLAIPYTVCFPNWGYPDYYWLTAKSGQQPAPETFSNMVRNAHRVVYVYTKQVYVGGKHTNFLRNDYMLKFADAVFAGVNTPHAYSRKVRGGTSHAILEAERKNLPIFHI